MSWHSIQQAILIVLESAFLLALMVLAGWVRFRQAQLNEEKKDRKADVQTLFDGKK
jgi:hypothetical protein